MSSTTTLTTISKGPVSLNVPDQEQPERKATQKLSQGVMLPGMPSFTSIDLQRRWMLEHMAGAFRIFNRHGFTEGLAGHISLRDPGKQ